MRCRHLIQEERYQISALLDAGFSQGAIAAKLNRSPSSVSRELSRNRLASSYQPQIAVVLAKARKLSSAKNARRVPAEAWSFAQQKLAETWSPQQIAGHQRAEHLPRLSHESIYQRIYEDKRAGGTRLRAPAELLLRPSSRRLGTRRQRKPQRPCPPVFPQAPQARRSDRR